MAPWWRGAGMCIQIPWPGKSYDIPERKVQCRVIQGKSEPRLAWGERGHVFDHGAEQYIVHCIYVS